MKHPKRTQANRRNARRSTGPSSAAGKKKAAKNSRRHGLAIPVCDIPEMGAKAERLASLLSGQNSDGERQEIARRIADAQIDLHRVRLARIAIINEAMSNPARLQDPTDKQLQAYGEKIKLLFKARGIKPHSGLSQQDHAAQPSPGASENECEASALADVSGGLNRIDRYERRALSRRKTAIRALDGA